MKVDLKYPFRLDLKALAVLRIVVALFLAKDLLLQVRNLEAHFTGPGLIASEAKKQAKLPDQDYRNKKGELKKAYTRSPNPRMSIAALPWRKFQIIEPSGSYLSLQTRAHLVRQAHHTERSRSAPASAASRRISL